MITKKTKLSYRSVCGLIVSICAVVMMSFQAVNDTSAPDIRNIPEIAPVDLERVIRIVPYGERRQPQTSETRMHTGIDFEIPEGADVVATASGVIEFAKYDGVRGNHILIKHGENFSTQYSHLKTLLVKQGEKVVKGQVIASAGNSGLSTRPHLHYEIFENGKMVDPKGYLPRLPG